MFQGVEHLPVGTYAEDGGVSVLDANDPVPAGAQLVSPSGDDANPGTLAAPWKALDHAFGAAPAGGTIVLCGGTDRETASWGGKALVLQPYPHETVWLSGSVPVTGWSVAGSRWQVPWMHAFPPAAAAAAVDPAHPEATYPDMVFIDGVAQRQVASAAQLAPGAFFVDGPNHLLELGSDPTGHAVEATVLRLGISVQGGADGTVIRHLGLMHDATSYGPTYAAALRVGANHVTVEGCTLAWNGYRGLEILGTENQVRDSTMAFNGESGASGYLADRLVFERNALAFNNVEHFARLLRAKCGPGIDDTLKSAWGRLPATGLFNATAYVSDARGVGACRRAGGHDNLVADGIGDGALERPGQRRQVAPNLRGGIEDGHVARRPGPGGGAANDVHPLTARKGGSGDLGPSKRNRRSVRPGGAWSLEHRERGLVPVGLVPPMASGDNEQLTSESGGPEVISRIGQRRARLPAGGDVVEAKRSVLCRVGLTICSQAADGVQHAADRDEAQRSARRGQRRQGFIAICRRQVAERVGDRGGRPVAEPADQRHAAIHARQSYVGLRAGQVAKLRPRVRCRIVKIDATGNGQRAAGEAAHHQKLVVHFNSHRLEARHGTRRRQSPPKARVEVRPCVDRGRPRVTDADVGGRCTRSQQDQEQHCRAPVKPRQAEVDHAVVNSTRARAPRAQSSEVCLVLREWFKATWRSAPG
jgi:hypothetical protein